MGAFLLSVESEHGKSRQCIYAPRRMKPKLLIVQKTPHPSESTLCNDMDESHKYSMNGTKKLRTKSMHHG
ncbi:hypothetical protein CB1_000344003 [Camelus ferus]|nr:hypothetical protein CB1_000344003 [Camelus ferus]